MKYPEMIELHPPLYIYIYIYPENKWWLGGFEGGLWYAACYSFWDEITLPHHYTQLHCVKFFGFRRLNNQPLFFVAPSHIAWVMGIANTDAEKEKKKIKKTPDFFPIFLL